MILKQNQEGKREKEQRESVLTRTRGRAEKKDYRNSKVTFNLLLKADTYLESSR